MEEYGQGTHCTTVDAVVWKKIPQISPNLFNTTQGPVLISLVRAARILYDTKISAIQTR
jgi:hypothetical protein